MKASIQFVGTGGAFDVAQGNSAAIVRWQDKNILIDCGYSVYTALRAKNLVDTLDAVLITHLHDDHAGSLSTLLYHRYFFTPDRPLTLLYPDDAFRDVLMQYLHYPMQDAALYCNLELLASITGADYIDTFGLHVPEMYTYAYTFGEGADGIAYSGDLGDGNFLFKYLEQMPGAPTTVFHDTAFFDTKVHAHYSIVQQHASNFTIYGYHHDHTMKPKECQIKLVGESKELLAT